MNLAISRVEKNASISFRPSGTLSRVTMNAHARSPNSRPGSEARKEIETFVGQKVFLELFVKVRPKWRENDLLLKEYGYG